MRFGRFFLVTGLQLAAAVGLFWLIAPAAFLQEVRHPLAIVVMAVISGVPLSLFEYLYHRYLLHSAVLPFLGAMHDAHSLHHSLTSVKAPIRGKEPEQLVPVHSEYPVEHEHQTEAMEFPWFACSVFLGMFFLTLGLPTKHFLPGTPAILAIFLGVTMYYSAYELWHAVLHLPYDQFWKPAMSMRGLGPVVKRTYAFHLMHHWRPTANLAIVGLWGVAVWDYALRTHRRPDRLPLHGAAVNYHDAAIKRPFWPIAAMDKHQANWYRWSRKIERWSAATFLGRRDDVAKK